jgi:hypothetical protein
MVQKKLLNFLLTIVVLLYIVFEELIWERFAQPIINYINSLKILKKLELSLQYVNSKLILTIFLAMFVVVEFLGLYAGALFLEGKVVHGALLYAGKIPIAAFTFWLFRVTKHKLMEFRWFEKSYLYTMKIIDKIKECDIYKSIKYKTTALKSYLKEKFFKDKSTIKRKIQIIYKRLKELLRV